MAGLFGKVSKFARSPHGQRVIRQATDYARSEKGRRHLDTARQKLAARRRPPAP